jgi:arylsulfatase A
MFVFIWISWLLFVLVIDPSNGDSSTSSFSKSSSHPNIVLLLADNLGYNDISLFGAPTAQTPNLDRLGWEGIKLNNWNSAAHLCSASRAAILTGKYPAKMGIYPRVFKVDAVYGMLPEETTVAEYLKPHNYSTSIVGKWHLGHRPEYLPTQQGFDDWMGIPYHMSGGSVDGHECYHPSQHSDHGENQQETMWLPLYHNEQIIQQPVQLSDLAKRYATHATNFLEQQHHNQNPFFLFMSFSHVHQLCAPKFGGNEQQTCQWASKSSSSSSTDIPTFVDAVQEMDWIAGQILDKLDQLNFTNNTLVLFTSDNGPWVAEQECAGSKGPFEGRWLQQNVPMNCTACPSDFFPDSNVFRQCRLPSTNQTVTGIHCGIDSGLGSLWEANLRMPAIARWPGKIKPHTESMEMLSSLDIVPTILSILNIPIPKDIDGIDVSSFLFQNTEVSSTDTPVTNDRVLFFWRDGFRKGPLPQPYGRFDVAAVKVGRIKAWLWTKSGHYNDDEEVYHDPPLLFDVLSDPAEAFPLDPSHHEDLIKRIAELVREHKASTPPTFPLALWSDPQFLPCVNRETNCRTSTTIDEAIQ